ncbi:MAG: hypothetical protein QW734_04415 [Candidatus Bathyarchaeia archaeon]
MLIKNKIFCRLKTERCKTILTTGLLRLHLLLIVVFSLCFTGYGSFVRIALGLRDSTNTVAQQHPPDWFFVGDRWASFWISFSNDLITLTLSRDLGTTGLSPNWFWIECDFLPIHISSLKTGLGAGILGTPSDLFWAFFVAFPMVYWLDVVGGSVVLGFEWLRTAPQYWCVWIAFSAYIDIGNLFLRAMK